MDSSVYKFAEIAMLYVITKNPAQCGTPASACLPVYRNCAAPIAVPHDGAFLRDRHHVLVLSATAAPRTRVGFTVRCRGRGFAPFGKIHGEQHDNKRDKRHPRKKFIDDPSAHGPVD